MVTRGNASDGAYYSVRQAAAKLGVTPQRVRQLCITGELEAVKKDGAWLVEKSAVHERYATRPPKVVAGEEGGSEALRRTVREFAEAYGDLKGELVRVRDSEKTVSLKLENALQKLEVSERELREEREISELHLKKAQVASQRLVERDATIKKLKVRLSAG